MKHKPVKVGDLVKNKKKACVRCGAGTYMAEHKQKDGKIRHYCGKCRMCIWE